MTTHTIDVEAERRSFEQDLIDTCKAQGDGDEYATLILQRSLLGDYSTVFVQARFDGWLAAKRSIQPTIAAEDVRDAAYADAEKACAELLTPGAEFVPIVHGCIAAIRARSLAAIATPTLPSKG